MPAVAELCFDVAWCWQEPGLGGSRAIGLESWICGCLAVWLKSRCLTSLDYQHPPLENRRDNIYLPIVDGVIDPNSSPFPLFIHSAMWLSSVHPTVSGAYVPATGAWVWPHDLLWPKEWAGSVGVPVLRPNLKIYISCTVAFARKGTCPAHSLVPGGGCKTQG